MKINLVTALAAEARPLIDALRLKSVPAARGFRLFENDDTALVVTGIGQLRAAAAVGWLAARQGDAAVRGWLNVGIAGHGARPYASAFMAGRIRDGDGGSSVYPAPTLGAALPLDTLITVNQPELNYPTAAGYDMEAFAVWDAATRFVSGELVQFLKIVSDGPDNDIGQLNRESITALVAGHTDSALDVMARLRALVATELTRVALPDALDSFTQRWHFTVSARHELIGLLRACEARLANADVMDASMAAAGSAREALAQLRSRIDSAPDGLGTKAP